MPKSRSAPMSASAGARQPSLPAISPKTMSPSTPTTGLEQASDSPGANVNEGRTHPLVLLAFASHAYQEFHLLMPLYLCRRWLGSVVAQEDQELRWVKPNELSFYD